MSRSPRWIVRSGVLIALLAVGVSTCVALRGGAFDDVRPDDPREATGEPVVVEPAAGPSRVRLDPPPDRAAARDESGDAASRRVTREVGFAVMVVGGDGVPVPGATVELRRSGWSSRLHENAQRWSATTDEEGHAALHAPPQEFFEARAWKGDLASVPVYVGQLELSEAPTIMRIGSTCTLTGVVLRRDGVRVPDAVVSLDLRFRGPDGPGDDDLCVETDDHGEFTVDGVPIAQLRSISAEVKVDGALFAARNWEVEETSSPPHLVLRESVAEVRGRVLDESGAPFAGAEVEELNYPVASNPLETGASGAFSLSVKSLDLATVLVQAPGYAKILQDVPDAAVDGVVDLGDLQLERGRTVTGRAVRPDGAPVAGVCVTLCQPPEPTILAEATSDARGEFALLHVVRRRHWMRVNEPGVGYASESRSDRDRTIGVDDDDVTIVLVEPVVLRIRWRPPVTDEPWTASEVIARVWDPGGERCVAEGRAVRSSDSSIEFRLDGSGDVEVRVSSSDGSADYTFRGVRIEGPGPIELEAPLVLRERE